MSKAKKITLIAAVAAMAIVLTAIIRFPITSLPFLKYDPKDVVLTYWAVNDVCLTKRI